MALLALSPPGPPLGGAPSPPSAKEEDRQHLALSWPMYGGTNQRNPANPFVRGIADDFCVKKGREKNVKWVAKLGTHAYGGPVI